MPFPASAFCLARPKDLGIGQLFRTHGRWAMRADHTPDEPWGLLLEGNEVGQLRRVGGAARDLAIAPLFGWFVGVEIADATRGEIAAGALVLLLEGQRLIGIDSVSSRFDPEYFAFETGGAQAGEWHEQSSQLHFPKWTIELCRSDKPSESIGTIMQVGVAADLGEG